MVNGVEKIELIESDNLKINDVIQVNTGDRIASDGVIIKGNASIDEAMISGESLPVDKKVNDTAIGGTLVNEGSSPNINNCHQKQHGTCPNYRFG